MSDKRAVRRARKAEKRIAIQNDFYSRGSQVMAKMRERHMEEFTHHGRVSTYIHSVAVAYFSMCLANVLRLNCNKNDLIRGALLHDYFLYDNNHREIPHRWHGFTHPDTALKNADRDFKLTQLERDTIVRHMFPLTPIPPHHLEGALVCIVDKVCAVYELFNQNPYRKRLGFLSEYVARG